MHLFTLPRLRPRRCLISLQGSRKPLACTNRRAMRTGVCVRFCARSTYAWLAMAHDPTTLEPMSRRVPGDRQAGRRTLLPSEPPMTDVERKLLDMLAELIARNILGHRARHDGEGQTA